MLQVLSETLFLGTKFDDYFHFKTVFIISFLDIFWLCFSYIWPFCFQIALDFKLNQVCGTNIPLLNVRGIWESNLFLKKHLAV